MRVDRCAAESGDQDKEDRRKMEHLTDARFMEHLCADAELDAHELDHLQLCEECRTRLAGLRVIVDELAVARASVLRPEVEARYLAMFAQADATRPAPAWWTQATARLRAHLSFDSRHRALATGLRSAVGSSYRLLFAADGVEIELLVEPVQGRRRLVGEILDTSGTQLVPALVTLLPRAGVELFEVESDGEGRFLLEGVLPGEFALMVTLNPRATPGLSTVEVERLEIT
jgi:hypothetical protein